MPARASPSRAGQLLKRLRAANIQTLQELVIRTEGEMLKYRNFGRKSLNEIGSMLEDLDLAFGMDIEQFLDTQKN